MEGESVLLLALRRPPPAARRRWRWGASGGGGVMRLNADMIARSPAFFNAMPCGTASSTFAVR